MTRTDLVLWMLIFPWQTLPLAMLAGLGGYAVAAPRRAHGCHELRVEAWRLYALLTMLPALCLGAEAVLWGGVLAYRAPLVFTGLPWALGLLLVVWAPVPLLATWCWRSRAWSGEEPGGRRPGRPVWLAAALLGAGLVLMRGSEAARAAAWAALVDRAPGDDEAVLSIVRLKAHRYALAIETNQALDRALPAAPEVLALVDRAGGTFDRDLRVYLAARLEAGVASRRVATSTLGATDQAPGEGSTPSGAGKSMGSIEDNVGGSAASVGDDAVVSAIWTLTGDDRRTLRAYAAVAGLASPPEGAGRDTDLAFQEIAAHALTHGSASTADVVIQAVDSLAAQALLTRPLIDALAAHAGDPGEPGLTALGILLRDGSSAALRPILPRFGPLAGDPDTHTGPAWDALRARCMQRTPALVTLTGDDDPPVAAGARAVLDYVRQYCRRGRPAG